MRYIVILILYITHITANDLAHINNHYNFLQPLLSDMRKPSIENKLTKEQLLSKFKFLAKVAPNSKEFFNLTYSLMEIFQYQFYSISIDEKYIQERKKSYLYRLERDNFIIILKSIKNPSFFTLYSRLYLETLKSKRLQHNDISQLYRLANPEQQPYVQLLSYMDSVNQLNNISRVDQNNLYKKLSLLLFRLPKEQQKQILRYTALQISLLYSKESIEFDFNRLYAKHHTIKREDVLSILNFKNAETFKKYILKKKRSFFEEIVFQANMKALERNDIAKILATLYIQENNFIEARSYLRQAPRKNVANNYNPFNTTLALNNKLKYQQSYSARAFAETMTRLEERLDKEPKKARDYYLYGNGLYNKSWFGNFPLCAVFFRKEDIYINQSIPPTTNLTQAYDAYINALEIAEQSKLEFKKKEEFKAEVSYQLLKIEFNRALLNRNNYPENIKKMPRIDEEGGEKEQVSYLLKASRSFIEAIRDYKAEYSNTKYGEHIIQNSIVFKYL